MNNSKNKDLVKSKDKLELKKIEREKSIEEKKIETFGTKLNIIKSISTQNNNHK